MGRRPRRAYRGQMREGRGLPGAVGAALGLALTLPVAATATPAEAASPVAHHAEVATSTAASTSSTSPAHRSVRLDHDVARPSSGARSVRSWPGSKIHYWADLPSRFDWPLKAAIASWNRSGLDMSFVRTSKAKARLRITIGNTYGADGYATIGYQGSNWVHLRRGLVVPCCGEPPAYTKVVAAHIIAHELGHVLGLQHTSGCELMTPVLELPTCSVMASRIGYYSRIVDRAAVKKTVARYGGRTSLAPGASPLDPLPPRLRRVAFTGGFDADAPVTLSWTPPARAPSGSHVLVLVTRGNTCSYPVVRDYWGRASYDSSRFRVLDEVDAAKGKVTPAGLGITRHCYALSLVNRTGAGSSPQGKVLQSWVPAPTPPTVTWVRRTFDQTEPVYYKALVDFDNSHGEQLLALARPQGQCATTWPAGTSYQSHVVGATPGEAALVYAADADGLPILDACLTFFTMRADGVRISSAVIHQVGAELPPDPPVLNGVTRTSTDSYAVDADYDYDAAALAYVVRPEGQCVTTWPAGVDPMTKLVTGEVDTTGTSRPCLSFFTVNEAGATSSPAKKYQAVAAPLPTTAPTVYDITVDEFGDVSGHVSLDPSGPFRLAMTADTGPCQPYPAGTDPSTLDVSLYDDGTNHAAFYAFTADPTACLTFYAYNLDGQVGPGTTAS